MRYIFFGGKGGVGKTAMAGATAIWLAKQGKRVMLASTNPVHSLSGLLSQNVFGKATAVKGVPNYGPMKLTLKRLLKDPNRKYETRSNGS